MSALARGETKIRKDTTNNRPEYHFIVTKPKLLWTKEVSSSMPLVDSVIHKLREESLGTSALFPLVPLMLQTCQLS